MRACGRALASDPHGGFGSNYKKFQNLKASFLLLFQTVPIFHDFASIIYFPEPNCTDRQIVDYWHGQAIFGPAQDGVCQESCRDLGHVSLGFATLVNMAETA